MRDVACDGAAHTFLMASLIETNGGSEQDRLNTAKHLTGAFPLGFADGRVEACRLQLASDQALDAATPAVGSFSVANQRVDIDGQNYLSNRIKKLCFDPFIDKCQSLHQKYEDERRAHTNVCNSKYW